MSENQKKKIAVATNIVLAILVCVFDILYMLKGTLPTKSIASGLFFAMGLVNFVFVAKQKRKNLGFELSLTLGLLFAMLGDIFLYLNFLLGGILFAVGHILFFVAYCFLQQFKWHHLAYGLAIFACSTLFITLAPIFHFQNVALQILCIAYAFIISQMLGKSIANFVASKNLQSALLFVGSALFFFSDAMLLLAQFAGLGRIFSILCLATYYPSEILLASSMLAKSNQNKKICL